VMQMAKTVTALSNVGGARAPHISILADRTLGGVTASYAGVGDVIIVEQGAVAGLSGQRVFFFQAEDGIRALTVTGVQTCALPISAAAGGSGPAASGSACRPVAVDRRRALARLLRPHRLQWPHRLRDLPAHRPVVPRQDRKSVV